MDPTMDGKIKGRASIWRILLNALGFLDSRRIPRAVASSRKLNDINAPSASRLLHSRRTPSFVCVASL